MDNKEILEEFAINELEDRVEFGLCGGGDTPGDGDIVGGGGGGSGGCSQSSNFCIER